MANNDTFPKPQSASQQLCQQVLRAAGWHVAPFPDVDKAIIVGGPHTSNWDGVLGLVGKTAIGLNANLMIKDNLFKGPLGWLLRRCGAIPIDRSRSAGMVEQTVEEFAKHDRLYIVVTPEGTRSRAPKWKTGFYHIAHQAGVPIVVALADYQNKRIVFPEVMTPSGDLERDLQHLHECFASVRPKRPEKLSAPVKALWEQRQGGRRE